LNRGDKLSFIMYLFCGKISNSLKIHNFCMLYILEAKLLLFDTISKDTFLCPKYSILFSLY